MPLRKPKMWITGWRRAGRWAWADEGAGTSAGQGAVDGNKIALADDVVDVEGQLGELAVQRAHGLGDAVTVCRCSEAWTVRPAIA